MKKLKGKTLNVFLVCSVLFDIAAILTFVGGNHNSMGFVWLCLGSMFLCFGVAHSNKSQKTKDQEEE